MMLIFSSVQLFSSNNERSWTGLATSVAHKYTQMRQHFILNFTDIHDGRKVLGSEKYTYSNGQTGIEAKGFITMYEDGFKSITCFSDDPKIYDVYFKQANLTEHDDDLWARLRFCKNFNSKKRKWNEST